MMDARGSCAAPASAHDWTCTRSPRRCVRCPHDPLPRTENGTGCRRPHRRGKSASRAWASVTMLRGGCFDSALTDEAAARADLLQYDIGSGPCVDAVLDDSLYVTGDVEVDSRWPTWGQRAAAEVGIRSVLAMRLYLHHEDSVIAGLNIYGLERDAFDDHAVGMGLVLATHASSVVGEMLASDRAENLMKALQSNRDIGVAIGVLMQTHQFTRDQAFDVLRVASQDSNRKLADVAAEVAETGVLSIRRRVQPGRGEPGEPPTSGRLPTSL